MLKKIMLIVMVITSGFVQTSDDQRSNVKYWTGFVAATAVVAGTGVYVACRESNEVKMERAEHLCDFYSAGLRNNLAKITTEQDVLNFVSESVQFKKELTVFMTLVECSFGEIRSRYASWLKPWNWNNAMKIVYHRIKNVHRSMGLVKIMLYYQPLILTLPSTNLEDDIVKAARTICQGKSSYPMIMCADTLKQDIRFLKNNYCIKSVYLDEGAFDGTFCANLLIDMLERFLASIVTTRLYVEEKRIQDELNLQERQTKAQEQQALAQQLQAQAQLERNRIEAEKLRLEKEKRDQE